ncbi:hypothetical protein [Jeotgalibacillus haloalkalitolerans]|uniref:Uncharacterized protein n=1 Tax=Jeotgalibacillus haloalkalitolerans TaxID=3104292 RepID=A0ABU5KI87_9BACL|nr:hypothetical protein [Jeotgalibacillus sp. HH7-29]MDZ5710946.1 hypothetical protein [Jeotgalibacillus sp. HH7-29]
MKEKQVGLMEFTYPAEGNMSNHEGNRPLLKKMKESFPELME